MFVSTYFMFAYVIEHVAKLSFDDKTLLLLNLENSVTVFHLSLSKIFDLIYTEVELLN